jgi:hypothetical protein
MSLRRQWEQSHERRGEITERMQELSRRMNELSREMKAD